MRELVDLKADVEHLKSAFGQSIRIGAVAEMDAAKGYRLKLGEGEDGEPFLSPWLPHPETGKTSVPLKIGQIVGIVAASGDLRQGMVFRTGYGGDHSSPNADMNANVFEDAGVRVELADGKLVVTAHSKVAVNAPAVELGGEGGRVDLADGRFVVTASSKVVVNAPAVELGGEGGKPVARVGDRVRVGSGSSAGLWPIVEGSSAVKAVD